MYKYEYILKLKESISYIVFYSVEKIDEDYIKGEFVRMYNTGEYIKLDGQSGEKYIDAYNMNRDLVEKHDDWYLKNDTIGNIYREIELG